MKYRVRIFEVEHTSVDQSWSARAARLVAENSKSVRTQNQESTVSTLRLPQIKTSPSTSSNHATISGVLPNLMRNQYQLVKDATAGCTAHLSFEAKEYTSYMQFEFNIPSRVTSDAVKAPIVKLGKEIYEAAEIEEITTSTVKDLALCKPSSRGSSFRVILMFLHLERDHMCSERLFVKGATEGLQPVREAFANQSVLAVVITMTDTSQFQKAFQQLAEPKLQKEADALNNHLNQIMCARPKEPVELPKFVASARLSFFNWADYRLAFALGAEKEREVEEKECKPFKCKVRVLEARACNNKNFIAMFEPLDDVDTVLRVGDKAFFTIDKVNESKQAGDSWDMTICPTSEHAPPNTITARLVRRWSSLRGDFEDKHDIPVIRPSQSGDEAATFKEILDQPAFDCHISPVSRHGTYERVFQALGILNARFTSKNIKGIDRAVLQYLLSNQTSNITMYDVYAPLHSKITRFEDTMNLNESQKDAVRQGRQAPAGFLLCHGGPGTGKTHFVIEAVSPFLLHQDEHRLLLTSPGNHGTDDMAVSLHKQLDKFIKQSKSKESRYIVRAHSIQTEKEIIMWYARNERSRNSAPAPKPVDATEGTKGIMTGLGKIQLSHDETSTSKFEGLEDERVSHPELSIGHRMLQMVGILPDGPKTDSQEFHKFKDLYDRYVEDGDLSSSDKNNFDDAIVKLMAFTIENASAVCATLAGAVGQVICDNYKEARLLVVDEAARVHEPQWWPLLAFYPKAIGKIMVGDKEQLPPHLNTENLYTDQDKEAFRNPFLQQMKISLQERAQANGFKSCFFTTQHRSLPEIAAIYNNVHYSGRLQHDQSTRVENRPLAQLFIQHTLNHYRLEKPILFYTVKNAEVEMIRKSSYCNAYADAVCSILRGLLTAGFGVGVIPCKIAVITPYVAQWNLYQSRKDSILKDYPGAEKAVSFLTLDKVQGCEYDIVIIDPVVVTHLGFLSKNRLNVLFSRARCGLYVVGDDRQWARMKAPLGQQLSLDVFKRIHKAIRQYRRPSN